MSKHRYFLDANVIISGLLWKGNERKLLNLGENRKLSLITSVYVLREVEDVLIDMEFENTKVTEFLICLRSFVELIDVPIDEVKKYWDVLNDKSDVPVLAGAIKSKSTLVTGDAELLEKGVKFLSVKSARKVLSEADEE